MTTIYLVRHGQSEANLKDIFLGQKNLDLTDLGHKQAQKTADYLKNIHIDKIYSSDLTRAYQTAEHTAAAKALPIEKNTCIREINAGSWELVPFNDLPALFPEDWKLWIGDIGHSRCTGGESVEDVQVRVYAEIEKLARENEGKTICLFSHATPIRTFLCKVEGLSLDQIKERPWPSNASVSEFEYENGSFKLIKYSEDSFMGDISTALPDTV